MFKATVVADSIGYHGIRIVSVAATYPRFIHAELMTHRAFARNAASSRAIPFIKYDATGSLVPNCTMAMLKKNPVIPQFLGVEKAGMQAGEELSGDDREDAISIIEDLMRDAMKAAYKLFELKLHKSIINRYLEPWSWITTLITATEWNNFFRLRCHPDAERHFALIAGMIRDAIKASTPVEKKLGQWHLPYMDESDAIEVSRRGIFDPQWKQKISAARCARLSYLTQDGERDVGKDIALAERLINREDNVIHASPLEHPAMCSLADDRSGPFVGWKQYRKAFANENAPGLSVC